MSETKSSPRPEPPAVGLRLKAPGSRPSLPGDADQPPPSRSDSPSSPNPTTGEAAAEIPSLNDGPGFSDDFEGDELGSTTTGTTSSRTSTRRSAPPLVDPKLFADDIAQMVGSLAQAANGRYGEGTELYLTTPDEERGIGEPVAGMLARRIPSALAGRGDDPDLADALRAAATLARYVMRQVRMRLELRRQARGAASPVDDALNGTPA